MDGYLIFSVFLVSIQAYGPVVVFLLLLVAIPLSIGAGVALASAVMHAVRRILPGSRPEPSAEYPDQTALDPWQRLEALDTELSRRP